MKDFTCECHHLIDAERPRQLLQLGADRPVADNQQADMVLRTDRLLPVAQKDINALFTSEPADEHTQKVIVRIAVFFPEGAFLFFADALRVEHLQIDRIGDDADRLVNACLAEILLTFFGRTGYSLRRFGKQFCIFVRKLCCQRHKRLWSHIINVLVIHGVQRIDERNPEDFCNHHAGKPDAEFVVYMDDIRSKTRDIFHARC